MATPASTEPMGRRMTERSGQYPSFRAREQLVALLQLAHSGELAAAHAYTGHAASVRDPDERLRIEETKGEELDHRARVRAMLDALHVEPDAKRERKLRRIGKTISAFCHIGGWFGPMYGAARFERKNIGEYERAAGYASACGLHEFVDDLIDMSEVEWRARALLQGEVRIPLALEGVPEMVAPGAEAHDPPAHRRHHDLIADLPRGSLKGMCMNCLSTAEATMAGAAFVGYAVKPRVHRALAGLGIANEPDPVAHDVITVAFLRSLDLDPVEVLGADIITAAAAWQPPQPAAGFAGLAARFSSSARPIGSHSFATAT